MRVVEQALPDQVRDVVRCLDLLAQLRNHGLKIERCHGITVVRRRSQRAQHQIQAVGHAITADFSLMQLDLSQDGLDFFSVHPVVGHFFNGGQHLGFEGFGLVCVTPFNTTTEHHLAHGFLKPA